MQQILWSLHSVYPSRFAQLELDISCIAESYQRIVLSNHDWIFQDIYVQDYIARQRSVLTGFIPNN